MMVPQTGHASAGRAEMSESFLFRFAFTVLAVFIVFLIFVERDDHALDPHDQLHVQCDAGHAGLEHVLPLGRALRFHAAHQIPGLSLDRTWRASSSSSPRSSTASSLAAFGAEAYQPPRCQPMDLGQHARGPSRPLPRTHQEMILCIW